MRIIIYSPFFVLEVRLNAPRQGIYAALLATSFAIHAVLMIQGAQHQLAVTRAAQGELMTGQLVADSLASVMATDTVGLALLTGRYTERADVASVRILTANGQILASGGAAATRGGQLFKQAVKLDQRTVGQVELTLIEPTRGEMIHYQWLPLLLSALLHALLWLLYRVIARPSRQPVLLNAPSAIVAPLAPIPTDEVVVVTPPSPSDSGSVQASAAAVNMPVQLSFGFEDPRQLLDTLSPSLAEPYYLLCQTLLDQAIRGLAQSQDSIAPTCKVLRKFNAQGALVGLSGAPTAMLAEYAIELASVFNLLATVVYRRHREQKHFALHTRALVTANQPQPNTTMPNSAIPNHAQLVEKLLPYARSHGVLVHAPEPLMGVLLRRTPLSPLEHPLNSLMREAMHVDGLSAEQASRIGRVRDQILRGTAVDSVAR